MDEVDLNGRMLLGKPIHVSKINIYPLTMDEIFDEKGEIGFEVYNRYLSILCIDSDTIKELLGIDDDNQIIEPFDYLYLNCLQNEELRNLILKAFNLFLKEQVSFCEEGYFLVGDFITGNIINRLNFNSIVDILKQQNCINNKSKIAKPQNEKQKEFFKKLKQMREKYAKYQPSQPDITDIMSSVCSKHPSINVFNIGGLTMYQLIDQYKRLNMIDEYFLSVESLLHGASKDEVKLIHWSSKK